MISLTAYIQIPTSILHKWGILLENGFILFTDSTHSLSSLPHAVAETELVVRLYMIT